MRNLAQELGVVPMALYKHVANKEELLDGMVDVIVGEIDPPTHGADWKDAVRQRILSARQALLRHRWASQVIESRTHATPVVLDYMNSLIGMFRAGGFSVDLTHHVMHALGSRMWGFTQEVFPDAATTRRPGRAGGHVPPGGRAVSLHRRDRHGWRPTTRNRPSVEAATTSSSSSSPWTSSWTGSSVSTSRTGARPTLGAAHPLPASAVSLDSGVRPGAAATTPCARTARRVRGTR